MLEDRRAMVMTMMMKKKKTKANILAGAGQYPS